jgi:DNA-directed RNA polymerase subunit beta'
VPVLPPDLRPLVPLDGGRFATSDFNDLYRRVINRNNRNRRLIELEAPVVILNSEATMLQQAVDALLINERRPKPVTGPNRRALRSLLSSVEYHFGALGARRVDYSAVARLVADPDVPARACKIPRSLAKELFRPIVYGILEADNWVTTIKSAKRAVEDEQPFALEAIERASRDYPALLMGPSAVVARTITLWDEPAIAVDPDTARLLATLDVCLHLPLTDEAKAECLALVDDPPPVELRGSGWLGHLLADPSACFEVLRDVALEGEQDEVVNPLLRAVFGRAPV